MKTSFRPFSTALFAALSALTLVAVAQQPPAAPDRPAAPVADGVAPATPTPEPAAPAAPKATTPALAADPAQTPAPAPAEPAAVPTEPTPAPAAETEPTAKADEDERPLRRIDERTVRSGGSSDFPFGDHLVPKDTIRREAVSIFGSTTVEGEVTSDAVSIFGHTRIGRDAKVGGAAVAVFGSLDVKGPVHGEAVSVLGGSVIDSHVHGEAVAVLGNLVLGPNAVIDGDIVAVGGRVTRDPGAVVRGSQVNVPMFGAFGDVEWLVTWVKRCLLMGRPLAFGPNLGWAWIVALSFLGFYLLLALILPRGIEKCATVLETRPGYSILSSILTVLLTPVAIVLLAVTVIGAVLVPFLGAGLLVAKFFGKAVMLAWIGRRFTRLFGEGSLRHPFFAVLIGGIIVLGLYTIPFFGFLLYKVLSWLGLGVVVYAIALNMKRERQAPAGIVAPAPVPVPQTVAAPRMTAAADPLSPGAAGVANFGGAAAETATMPPLVSPPPVAVSAATLPRAGFVVRMGALLIDVILVGLIVGFSTGLLPRFMRIDAGPPAILPLIAIYGAIMWKTKGTTIGGIIFGLKVVRLEGREMDWPTSIVRALSCFLSLIVAGLGFIWIAIDDEKQSWHDKIAGTAVVRVPKGVSLI